jgi:hypothetical protein
MPKMEPVPLRLIFKIPAGTSTDFIDISQCVSLLSRKFMRQGLLWAVGSVRVTMPAADSSQAGNAIYISTVQNSWVATEAWQKAFRLWMRQQQEALEDSESEDSASRFRDFKVFGDSIHYSSTNALPIGLGPGASAGPYPSSIVTTAGPLTGEWEYSQIVLPVDGGSGGTNERYLIMHGPSSGGYKGILSGYQNSRPVPQSPAPDGPDPATSWMNDMFDYGNVNTDVLANATEKNDELPYDQLAYPGADSNFISMENQAFFFNTNTIGERTYTSGGFTAPCGIIRIDQLYSDDQSNDLIVEVNLVPGDNRGYLAMPMQDVN